MPQLEIGVIPLRKGLVEGMKVAFIVTRRKRGMRGRSVVGIRFGTVLQVTERGGVIEDITSPGSRYNRNREEIFEAHVDATLGAWTE